MDIARRVTDPTTGTDYRRIVNVLEMAAGRLNPAVGDALLILLGVVAGTAGLETSIRRQRAAERVGSTSPESFRRNFEIGYLHDLAAELAALSRAQASAGNGGSTRARPTESSATDRSSRAMTVAAKEGVVNPERSGAAAVISNPPHLRTSGRSTGRFTQKVRQLLGTLINEHGEVELRRLLESVEARQQQSVFDVLRGLREEGVVSWDGGDLAKATCVRVELGHERMRLRVPSAKREDVV